jgi:hypothetical protein
VYGYRQTYIYQGCLILGRYHFDIASIQLALLDVWLDDHSDKPTEVLHYPLLCFSCFALSHVHQKEQQRDLFTIRVQGLRLGLMVFMAFFSVRCDTPDTPIVRLRFVACFLWPQLFVLPPPYTCDCDAIVIYSLLLYTLLSNCDCEFGEHGPRGFCSFCILRFGLVYCVARLYGACCVGHGNFDG